MPLCVGASIFGGPTATAFMEEEHHKSHSGVFLHGVGVCLLDCVVKCAGGSQWVNYILLLN